MIRRERQSLRVEIIDGEIAVRVDDDGPRTFLDRRGVNAITESLLNDDGVSEVTFRLREQIAYSHGLPRSTHAKQHRVLGSLVVVRAGERFDADKVVVRAVVNRFGGGQVTGERTGDGQHVGEETMFRVELS